MYRRLFCSVRRTRNLSAKTKITLLGLSQISDYYSQGEGTCSVRQFIYSSFILLVQCLDIHLLGESILCLFNEVCWKPCEINYVSVVITKQRKKVCLDWTTRWINETHLFLFHHLSDISSFLMEILALHYSQSWSKVWCYYYVSWTSKKMSFVG